MASIRTARVLAAVAALPLAAALFSGVAAADNATLQDAVGSGASNRSNAAQVDSSAFTTVQQGTENVAVYFTPLW
ncbi:hypothetical protein GCM10010503_31830 [Streptomyces lucensis JCM 4490]|uniref:Secreted protein n=1 Tax=Streptomyces lucensis JCM 4490 TaxID=1306176 RepID=A0A918J898_9ACTN|nr:hypothetical protein [Streptomyces lucensis]GGW52423.1 hypothetical protein GCM10010503_31830 [Streptomyces lucensis JCM 4490]